MGVRAKRGRWPDKYGDYEVINEIGGELLWIVAVDLGPDTEAVAESILAAINDDTVPAPTLPDDLPSWVSMHATATGADLIEHDPNGEAWERWIGNWGTEEWERDHADAAVRGWSYLVRRRFSVPQPSTPATERVGLEQCLGRLVAPGDPICGVDLVKGEAWTYSSDVPIDPDGMVTVLREDGAS